MMNHAPPPIALAQDRRGTALIEFALLLPFLMTMLVGMVAFGEYFLIAHGTQQLANDAARATLSGLTASERARIARDTVSQGADMIGLVSPDRITTSVTEVSNRITVTVQVDTSGVPLLGNQFVPMPSHLIRRSAGAHPGGVL